MEEEEKQTKSEGEETKKDNLMMWVVGAVIVIAIIVILLATRTRSTQPVVLATPSPTATAAATVADSTVVVVNQKASSSVKIDQAALVKPGYIVIHEQKDGELGPTIGNSQLYQAGTFENVTVELSRPAVSGETLYAMLHDDDGNGVYEFPGPDAPTQNAAGQVVLLPFEIE